MTNMIYIVVFVLGLLTEIQAGCPINCNCTENSVNCVSENLDQVPQFETLTNNPVIVDLSGNAIMMIDIDDFSFDKSDQVVEIFLNNTGIVSIEEGAFKDLESLQELYLSGNLLNSLPDNLIINNENMVLLDLSSNYFTDMPKIRSNSLEVLTLAESRIEKIPIDALEELPNLRMLVLSQNNLKMINPVIFTQMNSLFISMELNPWYCDCKTIKLFEFLTNRGFVDLTAPVQCRRDDMIFIDIYSDRGVMPAFQNECNNFNGNFEEPEETFPMEMTLKSLDTVGNATLPPHERHFSPPPTNDITFSDLTYLLMLGVSVVLSLIVGAVCGSYFMFKYMTRNIKQTESTKELICKSDAAYRFA